MLFVACFTERDLPDNVLVRSFSTTRCTSSVPRLSRSRTLAVREVTSIRCFGCIVIGPFAPHWVRRERLVSFRCAGVNSGSDVEKGDCHSIDLDAVGSPPGERAGRRCRRRRQSTSGTHRAPVASPSVVHAGNAQGANVGAVGSPPRGRSGRRCRRRRHSTSGTRMSPMSAPSAVHPEDAQGTGPVAIGSPPRGRTGRPCRRRRQSTSGTRRAPM